MDISVEIVRFDGHRLEITSHGPLSADRKMFLFREGHPNHLQVPRRALQVLELLMRTPEKVVSKRTINMEVWSSDDICGVDIQTCIKQLRRALGDTSEPRVFIESIREVGYKFLKPVVRDRPVRGDAEREAQQIGVLQSWNFEKFDRFLDQTTRDDDKDDDWGDLRIVTTHFSMGVPELFVDLLERGVRIRILFADDELTRARHLIRSGKSISEAVKEQRTQLNILKKMPQGNGGGSLKWLRSDVMPYGFVVHANRARFQTIRLCRYRFVSLMGSNYFGPGVPRRLYRRGPRA